jgi:hypothetical protein
LFLIGASNYLPEIREIIPLDYKEESGEFKKRTFPKEYAAFQKVEDWPKEDFLLEELSLPQFLAGQMAQRIVRKIREMEGPTDTMSKGSEIKKDAALDYKVESVKGHYINHNNEKDPNAPSFQLDFRISQSQTKDVIPSNLYDLSFEIIRDVIEKYDFKDFKEVRLSKSSSKDIKIIPKNAVAQ